jgi:DNA-binding SARP family transcriptional activator/Tol biopolymer transport system component
VIELRTLGAVDLRNADGAGAELRSVLVQPKRTAILAYLAVATPRGFHRRDSLVALFWPEQDAPHARSALRQALHGLRHALGEDVLISRGDEEVGIETTHCQCDVWAFEQTIDAGDLERAVGLYGGPFLQGFFLGGAPDFERWVEAERDRLSHHYAGALERLALAAQRRADHAAAVRWWSRLAAHSPYTSHVAVQLMVALDNSGDRAEAIQHAARHAARLRSDLDAEPDPVVETLAARLRGQPPRRDPPATVSAAPLLLPSQVARSPHTPGARLLARLPALFVGLLLLGLVGRELLHRGAITIATSDIRPVTSEPGIEFQPALSPDGNAVAFVTGPIGGRRLVVRSTVNGTAGGELRLSESAAGTPWLPRWSPDGAFVRFLICPGALSPWSAACVWKEVGRLGGPIRSVTPPRNASTAVWSPDGASIAFGIHDSIFSVSVTHGSTVLLATHPDHPTGLHSLAWSPDGRRLAYVHGNVQWLGSGNILGSSIWVVDVAGGKPIQITSDEFLNVSPAWLDSRHLLFVSNRDGPRGVYVVAVGPRGASGEPHSVPGAWDVHSIAYSPSTRQLVYAKLSLRQNIWSYPLRAERPISIRDGQRLTSGNQVIEDHDLSPDGRWIVYDDNLRGDANIYKIFLGGGDPVQLTELPGDELGPRWSPDGTEIAFYDARKEVMVIPAEGGTPVQLSAGPGSGVNTAWSPNGLQLALNPGGLGPREVRFIARDHVGGPWSEPVALRGQKCLLGPWAPNGGGVLCADSESILRVVSQTGRVLWRRDLLSTYGLRLQGYPGEYSRDGATLYLVAHHEDGRRGIWAIPMKVGKPRLVVSSDDPALSLFGFLSVGRDRLYATVSEYESDVWVMHLGW